MPLVKLLLGLVALTWPALASVPEIRSEPETIVRFENAMVRVVEIDYAPGDVAPEHRHEYPRTVYTIDGGTLELTAPDGSVATVDLAVGQTIWRPRETHTVTNVGDSHVRVLETEIK